MIHLTSRKVKLADYLLFVTTRKFLLKGVINAYSMLSGTKIKTEEAKFCSRCLRGGH